MIWLDDNRVITSVLAVTKEDDYYHVRVEVANARLESGGWIFQDLEHITLFKTKNYFAALDLSNQLVGVNF